MRLHFYSYRFADELLRSRQFKSQRKDILEVLRRARVPRLQRPKKRTRGGKSMVFTTDQLQFNRELEKEFRKRGWEVSPEVTQNHVTRIKADFKKNRVHMRLGLRPGDSWHEGLFRLQVAYSRGAMEVGVLVVARRHSSVRPGLSLTSLELVRSQLPWVKWTVPFPIWMVGIEPFKSTGVLGRRFAQRRHSHSLREGERPLKPDRPRLV